MHPPIRVPRFQPATGIRISPSINGAVSVPGFKEPTTKVSSVMPKASASLARVPVFLSSFWDRERDISIYRILITNVVSATSRYPAPAKIRFVPANWPALVRFVREITTATQMGSPPETARNPKVNDTGM